MTHIFVDTNIFLHFRFFVEIPWKKLFGSPYQLVLAPVVVDELDKHKRHPNAKTASRAKKVLSRFEQIVGDPGSFPLLYINKRPSSETFRDLQLDRQEQDDCILASIVEFGKEHNKADIIFISNDTGPRFRAASLGIKSGLLPEEFQNPNEPSEEQKQIQKLTQENNKLKNAMPKLSLTFKDGSTVLDYTIDRFEEIDQSVIDSEYEAVVGKFTKLVYEDPAEKSKRIQQQIDEATSLSEKLQYMGMESLGINSLTKEQVDDYNTSLESFLKKYRKFVEKKYQFKKIVALTVPIDLLMHNTGNAPATDIDVWLHFPDGFFLLREDQYPPEPREPEPPHKPSHRWDLGHLGVPYLPSILPPERSISSSPKINFSRPKIRETNSYEVDVHFKNLKHFNSIEIDELLVVYKTDPEVINFTIDYKITANNIPDQIVGKLSVVANIKE